MKWYDKPQKSWVYRWWYKVWLGSWNLNHDLYPRFRGVHISRPLTRQAKGSAGMGSAWIWTILIILFIVYILAPGLVWIGGL